MKPRSGHATRTDRTHQTAGGRAGASREDRPAGPQGLQRIAGRNARAGSKVQQRFARLIKQIEQRKQRLRAWYDAQPTIHGELAAYQALLATYRRTGHDLVCLFDRAYPDPIFTKGDRKKLRALICEIAGDLLAAPGFEDLKPIYNRHSRSDFDAEAAAADAVNAQVMKSVMEGMFGMDFGDADVSSTEKLQAHAEAQLDELAQEEEQARQRRARRKKSARQLAREAEREADQARAGKVLQEVYRKLAIALHPDLEQDPDERARKTAIMQQINVAYESADLLRLLELQLELEQIDPDHASEVAEDRLRHYNAILDQQVKELDAELDDLEMPWVMELDLASARISPPKVLARLRADADELRQQCAALGRDLESFQDVTRLKAWLKATALRRERSPDDLDLFRELDSFFGNGR